MITVKYVLFDGTFRIVEIKVFIDMYLFNFTTLSSYYLAVTANSPLKYSIGRWCYVL